MRSRARTLLLFVCHAVPAVFPMSPGLARSGAREELALNIRAPAAAGLLAELNHQVTAERCHAAARATESRFGLPPGILLAIGRVESGRLDLRTHQPEPWPWTVQALGKGLYFETKAEAITWVKGSEAKGITSIDTGCMQVNLYYHPNAFASLDEAFDPELNADYAGRFLRQLYAETGDWKRATGLYHSRTATISEPYQERVGHALAADQSPLSSSGKSGILARLGDAWRSTLSTGDPLQGPTKNDWDAYPRVQDHPFPPLFGLSSEHRRLSDAR
jgi:Transglycosylase SLT domain